MGNDSGVGSEAEGKAASKSMEGSERGINESSEECLGLDYGVEITKVGLDSMSDVMA